MALTPAEKMKRRREKLRAEGKYGEYKDKQKEFMKKSREKKKAKESKLPKAEQVKLLTARRKSVKERVAKHRELKKKVAVTLGENKESPAFKSNSALGKAAAKARRALPKSPRKKRTVIRKLFESLGSQETLAKEAKQSKSALSAETIAKVKNFYNRDDISRHSPGRKDVKTVRKNGKKTHMQLRHLINSIKETHALFCTEYGKLVGKSKFTELRPQHILLSSKLPHNVCLCKYHENYIMAINSMHKCMPEKFPAYSSEFPNSLICDEPTESCWLGNCDQCKGGKQKLDEAFKDDLEHLSATWNIWKENEDHRLCKMVIEGNARDLACHIRSMTETFMEHCYIKREQAKAYQKQRKAAGQEDFDQKNALIQVDFSENYTCVAQDEIQSAHWKQNQVSLFISSMWHSGKHHPLVLASDNLDHSKETVVCYMDIIFQHIPQEVDVIDVWSDGPSSQFKNKFIVAAIVALEKKHHKRIRWNYFATSHGKGPVDGIGGTIKRQVWNAVRARKQIVFNAAQFVTTATEVTTVKVLEVTSDQIAERNLALDTRNIFTNAKPVKGISKMHHLKILKGDPVCSTLSMDTGAVINQIYGDRDRPSLWLNLSSTASSTVPAEIKLGSWVEVKYEENVFPGTVTEIKIVEEQQEYKVSVMNRSGNFWTWPTPADEIFYIRSRVIGIISAPTMVNSRGYYRF